MEKKTENPDKSGKRQEDGKFKKGESGNPDGPGKGYKKLKTRLLEEKLEELNHDPLAAVIALAKDENTPLEIRVKLDMDLIGYVFPKRKAKDDPIFISLPKIQKIEDATDAMSMLTNAVSEGSITPSEGQLVSNVIESYRKIIEAVDFEKRLITLEKKENGK